MTKGNQWPKATLKLWYGGFFREGDKGLVYVGNSFRTVAVDADEMGWFTLVEEAEKCGFDRELDGIFFMSPSNGLQRALDDTHAQVICKMAVEDIVCECFIVPGFDVPQLMQLIEYGIGHNLMKKASKMIPIRKGPLLSSPTIETPALSNTKSRNSGQPSNKKSTITSQPKKNKSTNLTKASHKTLGTSKKAVCKTPTKASQKTQTLLRTSPRLSSKQPTSLDTQIHLKTTNKKTKTVPQPPSTEIFPDFPEPSYDFNDLRIADLFNQYEQNADCAVLSEDDLSEDEIEDPGYNPESESEGYETESDVELVDEDDHVNEALDEGDLDDLSDVDDELKEARIRRKKFNANALKIANQLQLEAASGKLSCQEKTIPKNPTTDDHTNINLSDYDESGDEEVTPGNSDEESVPGKRNESKIPVVNERSDFTKLKWDVGMSFPKPDVFRDCVTRYAIAQGRDLTFDISDNTHGRKLGVRCKSGCSCHCLWGC